MMDWDRTRPPGGADTGPGRTLEDWVGTQQERRERLDPWPAHALHALLDRSGPPPQAGDPLPPMWRWLYFRDAPRRGELGRDGHPAPGRGLCPPNLPPRRMWAGGRLRMHSPAPLGAEATRISRIARIERKRGRSGALLFVTLVHELYVQLGRGRASTEPVEIEEQDLVYRQDPVPPDDGGAPQRPDAPIAPQDEQFRRAWTADAPLLFRYSALTYNGHRIHYDLDYCRRIEGYPGLVVHGPLLATLLLELLRERGPDRRISAFEFKAVSPIFDTDAFETCGALLRDGQEVYGARLWVRSAGDAGRLAMRAEATYAPADAPQGGG